MITQRIFFYLGMIDEDGCPKVGNRFDHLSSFGVVRLTEFVILLFNLKDFCRCLFRQAENEKIYQNSEYKDCLRLN